MLPAAPKDQDCCDTESVFERVMIAVDGSRTSARALEVGHELAKRLGAAVALVHVMDITKGFVPELGITDARILEGLRVAGVAVLDRCAHELSPAGASGVIPVARFMCEGDPPSEIVKAADEWRADVIVMGTHARGPVARFLLGSTAEAVVRRAHCPVLTVGHTRTGASGAQREAQAAAS